jgi:hypothetical protein
MPSPVSFAEWAPVSRNIHSQVSGEHIQQTLHVNDLPNRQSINAD